MNKFSALFLLMLAATLAARWWLVQRQVRYVRAHRDRVPSAFHGRVSLNDHQKAADYTVAKTRFGRLHLLADAVILLLWTLGGGLAALDTLWRGLDLPPLATGTGFLLSVAIVSGLFELPFSVYRTFVIEERFGFNRTSPRLFVTDHLKQLLLLLVLGGGLAAGVLWVLLNAGPLWWLYAWVIWLAFSLLMVWGYPVFIAPLFNRFLPLEDEALRRRIEALLQRNALTTRGIFVMDGSRRSGHGNAYFTGLGANKRIVFFDTLLGQLAPDEMEAVLAHEIGHFQARHIRKRMLVLSTLSLAGLALLGWLVDQPWFYAGLGVPQPSGHTALALFMLISPAFTFVLQPLLAWLSRRHEFEADDFAASQASAGSLVRALVKLYAENASTLTPDPLYSAVYDSHPPAPVRVAHLSSQAA
jgi:STE24 endopeptidase